MKNKFTDVEAFAERFTKLLQTLDITAYQLAKEIDTSEALISNIKKGKSLPGAEVLAKILNYNKVINIHWLLTGDGTVLLEDGWANTMFNVKGDDEPRILKYKINDTFSQVAEENPNENDELERDFERIEKQLQALKQKIINNKNKGK